MKTLAVCQLYDKERLERGQSTNNIMSVSAIVEMIDKRERKETEIIDDNRSERLINNQVVSVNGSSDIG